MLASTLIYHVIIWLETVVLYYIYIYIYIYKELNVNDLMYLFNMFEMNILSLTLESSFLYNNLTYRETVRFDIYIWASMFIHTAKMGIIP